MPNLLQTIVENNKEKEVALQKKVYISLFIFLLLLKIALGEKFATASVQHPLNNSSLAYHGA